jgi:N-(2-amino-2-carboxyethyl)-L-glutamate synthase
MHTQHQVALRIRSVAQIIRETPVIPLQDERVDLFAKLEYVNGIGSIKDRPAFWILKRGIERGEIGPDTTVVESSSGNFACALAAFCKILELDFIPVVDPNISPFYESALRAQCTRVIKVANRDDNGGFLKTRLSKVQDLLAEIPDSYWPNQYANTDGMDAHFYLTGAEIGRAVPKLDYAFIGVSSAGTVAGVSRYLKEKNPSTRIVAVDAEGSVIFGQKPKERWIPGLGSTINPQLLRHACIDDVVVVSEVETISACHELLDRHGLFVGGSTGTVYSAIQKYFQHLRGRTRPRVVFLCCDRGTAYLHNIFDRRWAAWRGSLEQSPATTSTNV